MKLNGLQMYNYWLVNTVFNTVLYMFTISMVLAVTLAAQFQFALQTKLRIQLWHFLLLCFVFSARCSLSVCTFAYFAVIVVMSPQLLCVFAFLAAELCCCAKFCLLPEFHIKQYSKGTFCGLPCCSGLSVLIAHVVHNFSGR